MAVNKRKKNSRQRGTHTHGWGHKKKHRGAGNRGGRGMAGTGKRGDANKPKIWGNKKYFGKYGFKKKGRAERTVYVNLNYLEESCDKLVENKLAEKQGDVYVIDGNKLGFNKVLGYGKLTKKLKISSASFSKEAVEKIQAAGGEVSETSGPKVAAESEEKAPKEEPKTGEAPEEGK